MQRTCTELTDGRRRQPSVQQLQVICLESKRSVDQCAKKFEGESYVTTHSVLIITRELDSIRRVDENKMYYDPTPIAWSLAGS